MKGLEKGLVQIYTGAGKGKTSAAFGLALRAIGSGLKVCVIQFIKGGFDYGELHIVDKLPNLTLKAFGTGKFIVSEPSKEDIKAANTALEMAKQAVRSGKYDIVVLDEVNVALHLNLIALRDVLGLIESKPASVELVLTGRDAPRELIDKASLVTEMRDIKHPYAKGMKARAGIEY